MKQQTPDNKLNLSVDLRLVVILLLVVIIGMFVMWKPWSTTTNDARTITVTGEAKISAEPDEYTFQPSYEFKDANKETGLANLTQKSDEIVKN